jgi:hypothetical protein
MLDKAGDVALFASTKAVTVSSNSRAGLYRGKLTATQAMSAIANSAAPNQSHC